MRLDMLICCSEWKQYIDRELRGEKEEVIRLYRENYEVISDFTRRQSNDQKLYGTRKLTKNLGS